MSTSGTGARPVCECCDHNFKTGPDSRCDSCRESHIDSFASTQSRLDSALLLAEKWEAEGEQYREAKGEWIRGASGMLRMLADELRAILSGPESSPEVQEEV